MPNCKFESVTVAFYDATAQTGQTAWKLNFLVHL